MAGAVDPDIQTPGYKVGNLLGWAEDFVTARHSGRKGGMHDLKGVRQIWRDKFLCQARDPFTNGAAAIFAHNNAFL